MKNRNLIIALSIAALAGVIFFFLRKPKTETTAENPKASLPINTIPVTDRPFVILTPDSSGRNITITLDNTTLDELIEYELVYSAGDKQEGAFGRINLATETQPVEKKLLLGSQSGGGKITYHEGVTGGSLTITYEDIRLKENFNFLHYDSDKKSYSSVDSRFQVSFSDKDLKDNAVIIMMKSFGLPDELEGEILAGPYAVLTASGAYPEIATILLSQESLGEGINPSVFGFTEGEWVKLDSTQEVRSFNVVDPETNIFAIINR